MTDVVVDSFSFELRVGDRVLLAGEEEILGTVTAITASAGEIVRTPVGGYSTHDAVPTVTVALDNGMEATLNTTFLRTPVWRWHADGIVRDKRRAPPRAHAQGA